jgi:Xaa-Pro aminopeptidase
VTASATPREAAVSGLLDAHGLDALVGCSYEALSYFAGTDIQTQLHLPERLEFFIAPRGTAPTLLVCNIEESQVRDQSPIDDVRAYVEFEHDPATQLAELLTEAGVTGRVGIEAHRLPASALRTLEERLPTIEWIAIDRPLEQLQIAKTPDEIARLGALAGDLLSALHGTLDALGPGSSEAEIGGELVSRVARTGAIPLFMVFSSGPRTTLGHPEPLRTALRAGAIWRTDFGARRDGLGGDVARTGIVGSPSDEQREIFATVRAAQEAAVALAEPGRPARELFFAVKDAFEAGGLPFSMPHVGHGIGFGLHVAPLLEPRNDVPLTEGAVLNIEPFAILVDRGEGYHTEDMVLVGPSGPERLTVPQEELLVIEP